MIGSGRISPYFRRGGGLSNLGELTRYHQFYGDSISLDEADYSAAGHCTSGDGGYTTRVAVANNIDGEWFALSSSTMWYHVDKVYENTDIQTNESASYMGGINNIRGDGDLPNIEGVLSGGLVAILSARFAKSVRKIVTDFTRAGAGWLENNQNIPKYFTNIIGSNNIGDTLTGTFYGDNIAINSNYTEDGTYGYEVRVDGVLKATVSTTDICGTVTCVAPGGTVSPYATLITGCGDGEHEIEITIIAGSGTDYVYFDALFELADFNDPYVKPFVWLQIPHANTNYWGTDTPPYNKGSNEIVDSCNVAMESAIDFFKGYSKFGIVRTNNYYNADDPAQGSTADGPYALHPGCLGSQYIANGFNSIVSEYVAPSQNSELTTWLSALSGAQPSSAQVYNLNYALTMLDEAGIIDNSDLIHFPSGLGTNEQRLAPIKTTGVSPFTTTDSLSITGFDGNGTTTFTNIKWKPLSHGVNFERNNCSIFVSNYQSTKSAGFMLGVWDEANKGVMISPQNSGIYASINKGAYQFNGIAYENAKGVTGMIRYSNASSDLIKDGLVINNNTDASFDLIDAEIYINALNDTAFGPTLFYAGSIGFILIGNSSIDYKRVDSIFKWYKRRNGF